MADNTQDLKKYLAVLPTLFYYQFTPETKVHIRRALLYAATNNGKYLADVFEDSARPELRRPLTSWNDVLRPDAAVSVASRPKPAKHSATKMKLDEELHSDSMGPREEFRNAPPQDYYGFNYVYPTRPTAHMAREIELSKLWRLHRSNGDDKCRYHPNRPCTMKFRKSEPTYRCRTCGVDGSCVLCQSCFENTNHEGHEVQIDICTRDNGGVCDCGDPDAWKCELHCANQEKAVGTETPLSEIPTDLVASLNGTIKTLIDFVIDVLSNATETLIPNNLLQTRNDIVSTIKSRTLTRNSYLSADPVVPKFCAVLYNDPTKHYLDAVHRIANATGKTLRFAEMVVNRVNSHGRALIMISSDLDMLMTKVALMSSTGLRIVIVSTRDFFREEMCEEIISWLYTVCQGSFYNNYSLAKLELCKVMCSAWQRGVVGSTDTASGPPDPLHLLARGLLPDMPLGLLLQRFAVRPHGSEPEIYSDELNFGLKLGTYLGIDTASAAVTGSRLQHLLLLDMRLWRWARTMFHDLCVSCLISNREYKPLIAAQYAAIYPILCHGFLSVDREADCNIMSSLSTQLFTPALISEFMLSSGAFSVMAECLRKFFVCGAVYSVNHTKDSDSNSEKIGTEPLISSLKNRKYSQIFFELGYILSRARNPELLTRLDILRAVRDLMLLFHGRLPLQRAEGEHVEYESQDYNLYFNAALVVAHFQDSFVRAFDRLVGADRPATLRVLEFFFRALAEAGKERVGTGAGSSVPRQVPTGRRPEGTEGTEGAEGAGGQGVPGVPGGPGGPGGVAVPGVPRETDGPEGQIRGNVAEITEDTRRNEVSVNSEMPKPVSVDTEMISVDTEESHGPQFKTIIAPDGSSHSIIRFCVSRDPVSFLQPLHSLVSQLIEFCRLGSLAELPIDPAQIGSTTVQLIFDYPLRVIVLAAQIKNNLWLRNGFSTKTQMYLYKTGLRKSCYFRDLYMVQMALIMLPQDTAFLTILDRWQLTDPLGKPAGSFRGISYISPQTAPPAYPADLLGPMLDEFVHFLLAISTERIHLLGLSEAEVTAAHIRQELVHLLGQKPSTYANICSVLSDQLCSEPEFDHVLTEVAEYVPPTGLADSGVYRLKRDCFKEINPYSLSYSANQREDMARVLESGGAAEGGSAGGAAGGSVGSVGSGNSTGKAVLLPPVPPLTNTPYAGLLKFSAGSATAAVLAALLTAAADNSVPNLEESTVKATLVLVLVLLKPDNPWMAEFAKQCCATDAGPVPVAVAVCRLLESRQFASMQHYAAAVLQELRMAVPQQLSASFATAGVPTAILTRLEDPTGGVSAVDEMAEKKRRAAERRKQIMAEMQANQTSFAAKHKLDADFTFEDSDLGSESDDSDSEDHKFNNLWHFGSANCILCQMPPESGDVFGVLCYVSKSSVFRDIPFQDRYWLPRSFSDPLSLDGSADDSPIRSTKPWNEFFTKTTSDLTVCGPGFPFEPAGDAYGGFGHVRSIFCSCGHGMHAQCFHKYWQDSRSRMLQLSHLIPEDQTRHEFVCPLCKAVNNVFVPLLSEVNAQEFTEIVAEAGKNPEENMEDADGIVVDNFDSMGTTNAVNADADAEADADGDTEMKTETGTETETETETDISKYSAYIGTDSELGTNIGTANRQSVYYTDRMFTRFRNIGRARYEIAGSRLRLRMSQTCVSIAKRGKRRAIAEQLFAADPSAVPPSPAIAELEKTGEILRFLMGTYSSVSSLEANSIAQTEISLRGGTPAGPGRCLLDQVTGQALRALRVLHDYKVTHTAVLAHRLAAEGFPPFDISMNNVLSDIGAGVLFQECEQFCDSVIFDDMFRLLVVSAPLAGPNVPLAVLLRHCYVGAVLKAAYTIAAEAVKYDDWSEGLSLAEYPVEIGLDSEKGREKEAESEAEVEAEVSGSGVRHDVEMTSERRPEGGAEVEARRDVAGKRRPEVGSSEYTEMNSENAQHYSNIEQKADSFERSDPQDCSGVFTASAASVTSVFGSLLRRLVITLASGPGRPDDCLTPRLIRLLSSDRAAAAFATAVYKSVTVYLRRAALFVYVIAANGYNPCESDDPTASAPEADRLCKLLHLPTCTEVVRQLLAVPFGAGGLLEQLLLRAEVLRQEDCRTVVTGRLEYPGVVRLINLPLRLDEYFTKCFYRYCYGKYELGDEDNETLSGDPAICLFCARTIKVQKTTALHHKGECARHCSESCSRAGGMFLLPRQNTILILRNNRGSFYPSPYLDAHGGAQDAVRKADPLYLQKQRWEHFVRNVWLQHGYPNYVTRKLESSPNIGGWETM